MLRPLRSATVVLAVLLSVGGCSDDDPSGPGAAPTTSATGDPSSASGEASPSGQPEPTGPVIEGDAVVLRLPEGYEVFDRGEITSGARDPSTGVYVGFSESGAFGDDLTLTKLAELARRNALTTPPPEILEPVSVDGVEVYHLRGPGTSGDLVLDEYGARVGGSDFSVRIEAPQTADLDAIAAEILAGVDVRD